jgi:hypothetical protein
MIVLKNWSLVGDNNPYTAPELQRVHLHGFVYGHPRHLDGKQVTTSSLISFSRGIAVTRSGSKYRIIANNVDPEYEKRFPNAYHRLKEQGKKLKEARL